MWRELWERHRGALVGVAFGLFLGIIYLISGFWDMLVLGFLIYVGYLVGRAADRGEKWPAWDEIARWLMQRWKPFR